MELRKITIPRDFATVDKPDRVTILDKCDIENKKPPGFCVLCTKRADTIRDI